MMTRRLGQFRCAVGSDNSKWVRRKPSSRVRHDAVLAEDDLRRAFVEQWSLNPNVEPHYGNSLGAKFGSSKLIRMGQCLTKIAKGEQAGVDHPKLFN